MAARTRLSTGDLQRELKLSRARLERILRDWARELPEPEVIGGTRTWQIDDLPTFVDVLRRDEERRP